jgi:hypothetical protein
MLKACSQAMFRDRVQRLLESEWINSLMDLYFDDIFGDGRN